VLAYQAAHKAGADDAVFIGEDDTVGEATAGNVFVVAGGRVQTPPNSPRLLGGITRDKILLAARAAGIPCGEVPVTKNELLNADEVFLTSTTAETVSVVKVDGKLVGKGKPGPVTARVYDQFRQMFAKP
jgi:branched-subunit amino acid aminotransferase/4-amino-4-deoxychorismate lyase